MATLAGTGLAVVAPDPCEVETTYHCARVVADPDRPGGRTLVLDTLRHSYVDLDDPTFLEFAYVQAIASVADVSAPAGEPVSALHVGGGGLTVPRYLAEVRPGSTGRVLEVDAGVLAVDRADLGLVTGPQLRVDVGDARIGLTEEPAATRDLVVGDAFGGLAVPWQLTTVEALQLVDRALTDDGVYAVNLIDHGPLSFLRAELATMRTVFPHVALLARDAVVAGQDGGNVVAVASRRPLDTGAVATALAGRGLPWRVVTGDELAAFVDDAPVLTDDFAPVDQLLTPTADPHRPIGAVRARVSATRSAGASSTCRPRRPPLTHTAGSASAESSTTVGNAFRWPSGLIPPRTYPVLRSASAGSAITARRPPSAAASALRSSCPATGTTATTRAPSTLASSVLNTVAGSWPSAATAAWP